MLQFIINGKKKEYEEGITFEEIAKEYQEEYKSTIAAVILNGKISELIKKPFRNGELTFCDLSTSIGHLTYIRTATLLFVKAAHDVIGDKNIEKIRG